MTVIELPDDDGTEFDAGDLGIVNAVLTHQPTYNGQPIPQWVTNHIKENQ